MATTKTWASSGSPRAATWRTFTNDWRDGSEVDRVYQGQYSIYGLNRGLWFFDDANIRSSLSGQRILSIKILIQRHHNNHGVYSAQTPTLRLHNYSSQPSGAPTMGSGTSSHGVSFALGEQKWVPLPTSWGDALKAGTARGIGLYTTSNTPYMYFYGSATLSITYEPLLNAPPTPSGFYLDSATTSSIAMSCNTAGSSGSNNLATTYRWDREGGGTATTSSPSFNNTGLSAGLTDRWRVRAENAAGVSSYTGYLTGRTKPAVPGNLRQTGATTTSVTASWNSVTGATLYRLRRSNGSESTTTGTSTAHGSLAAGTTYSMQIRAEVPTIYGTGGAGAYSSYVSMTTLPLAPGIPTASNITHTSATLSWGTVTGATSYIVQRKTGVEQFSTVRVQSGTTWTDDKLSPGTTYEYRVAAVSAGGQGGYSGERTVSTVALPAVPTGLAASDTESYQTTLTWNSVGTAVAYTLQRLSPTGSVLASWTTANTTYTDTGILPGGEYQYRVRSESSLGGTSNYSGNITVNATPRPQLAPSMGMVPNYDAVENGREIRWDFNTNNINDGQQAFNLEITRVSDGLGGINISPTVGAMNYVVPAGTLANDTEYRVRVRTRDAFSIGFGPWSDYVFFDTVTLPEVSSISAPLDGANYQLSTNPEILVEWIYSQAASTPQDKFRVTFTEGVYTVYDSGWVTSSLHQHPVSGLTAGTYDVTVQVSSNGVVGGSATSTNVSVASDTKSVIANDPVNIVQYDATAGHNGGGGFVIDKTAMPDNMVTVWEHAVFHFFPDGDGWNKYAQFTLNNDEFWDTRKVVEYGIGTNLMLSVVAKADLNTATPASNTSFGIVLEYSDDTEEESFIMDILDDVTISTDIGGGFKRYTTSILAKKDVVAIRLRAHGTFYNSEFVSDPVISQLDVTRNGRIYSQEYVDTNAQRGLLVTGSGYIQGTELDIRGDASVEGVFTKPDTGTMNIIVDDVALSGLKLIRDNNALYNGTWEPVLGYGGLGWTHTDENGVVTQFQGIHIAKDGTVGINNGGAASHGEALQVTGRTVMTMTSGPQLSIDSGTGASNFIEFRRHGMAGARTGYIGNASTAVDDLYINSDGAAIRMYAPTIHLGGVATDNARISTGAGQAEPTYTFHNRTDMGMYANGDEIRFSVLGTARVAINSSYLELLNNLQFGRGGADSTTVSSASPSGFYSGSYGVFGRVSGTPLYVNRSDSGDVIAFRRAGAGISSISVSTTTVSYNTGSDYRLKENERPIDDAIERVKLLRPYRLNFIAEPDETIDAFFAHELADVVPNAVRGEKDAVDEDGNPDYQQVDHSKLVPLLTAALQGAIKQNEQLEARIEALEARF